VFSETSSIMMETAGFYTKWLKDIAADQRLDGKIPGVVPDPSRHVNAGILGIANGSAGFSDAAVIIPWNIYQAYGDKRILENQYRSMRAWVDYVTAHARKIHWIRRLQPRFWLHVPGYYQYIWDTGYHWGEWQEPDRDPFLQILLNLLFSQPEVATAYYAHSSWLLSRIAEILGRKVDAGQYAVISNSAKEAWQKEFIRKDGRLRPDRQATYVRALAFDLLPVEKRPLAVSRLVELIEQNGYHIGTGFLSTTFINRVLAQNDLVDVAYKLLLQETRPSWLYPVTKGATTIWEFWDVIKENGDIKLGSMNHYSPGAVGSWLYQCVAGIRPNPNHPGYLKFVIHPLFGGGLTDAKASYLSTYGEIRSEWKIQDKLVTMKVSVPVNTTADVVLPGAKTGLVKEGGQPIHKNEVFKSIKEQGNMVIVGIGSGNYDFTFPMRE